MEPAKKDLDDEEFHQLLEKSKANDSKALGKLCDYFYLKIYRFIYYRVNAVEDAEDLTSEVCIRVIKSIHEQTGSFPAWIFRIASNLVTDFYRRRSVRQSVESVGALIETVQDNGNQVDATAVREELKQALLQLTDEQQQVIVLKFIEGYETDEIAEMLGKSAGAIRGIQFRALTTLRIMLDKEALLGKEENI